MKPHEIRQLRRFLGLTQVEFSDILGLAPITVSSYEQGRRKPSQCVVQLLRYVKRDAMGSMRK